MAENKIGKYLLYAVGEIALVVIGIMIAVALNNSNEQKKIKAEEQRYLLALKEEFTYNQEELERVQRTNSNNVGHALELVKHTGPATPTISEEEFNSIYMSVIQNEVQFHPSPGALNEIISSGKLGGFTDENLKGALASWEAILKRVEFQENEEVLRSRDALMRFSMDKTNWRRSTYGPYGEALGFGPSKFKGENQTLLQIEEFENLILQFMFSSQFLNDNYYPRLEAALDEILQLIDKNIVD